MDRGAPVETGGCADTTVGIGEGVERLVRDLLVALGEDPSRDGLAATPRRVRQSLAYLTRGYRQDPRRVIGDALFEETYDGLVLVRDIEFYSLCEHHLLPFHGRVHVGYVPAGRIIGLSKVPRLVDVYARRLQVQERLTRQIAEAIEDVAGARGVGVVVEATHLCMAMRGVSKQHSRTRTRCLLGTLESDPALRREFLAAVGPSQSA